MWKRLRASWRVESTSSGQYTKIDFAGLHISYDHMWWFMAKQSIEGEKAFDRLVENIVKQAEEKMNEQQHASR
jgi:hypothetical protein